jgi:hypothetical protein
VALSLQRKTSYKTVIISVFGKTALLCPDQIALVPEAWQTLVDNLAETGNPAILGLLLYCAENNDPFVYQTGFVSHLLNPLLQVSKAKTLIAIPIRERIVNVVSDLLLTWPGIIWYGLRAGLLRDLLRLLPRHPDVVLSILSKVLNFSAPPTVIDGYVGFALAGLLPLGLVNALSKVAPKREPVAAFLASISPYIPGQSGVQGTIAPRSPVSGASVASEDPVSVYKLARALAGEANAGSIAQFSLPPDSDLWNWMLIRRHLTVVLPDDPDLCSPAARTFYRQLLDFFGGWLDDSHWKFDSVKSESICALVRLLINHDSLASILESHPTFRAPIVTALTDLIATKKPLWPFFRCFAILLCAPRGWDLITKSWKCGDLPRQFGECCRNATWVPTIFSCFRVRHLTDNTAACIGEFLRNKVADVFRAALQEFLKMAPVVEDYEHTLYENVIVKYLKSDFLTAEGSRRSDFVSFLYDLLTTHRPSLALTATDPELHVIIRENARYVYPLLFSEEDSVRVGILQDEIAWWLETGNAQYVGDYQEVVNSVHAGKAPSAHLPPHLFGQIGRLEVARETAQPFIPRLISDLGSPATQRGALFALAHFASEKAAHPFLHDAFGAMIDCWDSGSYEVKGAVIAAFALVPRSKYLAQVLADRNWQFFAFGNRSAVLPCDFNSLAPETAYSPPAPIDNTRTDQLMSAVKQLPNGMLSTRAKAFIEAVPPDKKAEMADFALKFISTFSVPPDGRDVALKALAAIPAIPVRDPPRATPEDSAAIAARIWVAAMGKEKGALSALSIPFTPLSSLTPKNVCVKCPEAFLTDSEFSQWAGLSKSNFYALAPARISEARSALLNHQPFK